MKVSRRTSLTIILIVLLVCLGVLFRAFLFTNVVRPLALVLWLFWQILLSFDQRVTWGLLLFAAVVYVFIRVVQRLTAGEEPPPPASNVTLEKIHYWRLSMRLTAENVGKANLLKNNLKRMLASLFTSKQTEAPYWEIEDALRYRRIPLPEPVHAFLFPEPPREGRRSLWEILESIRKVLVKWARRRSGRATAEYYESIEEVLTFMESAMEIKNDDKRPETHIH
jgi:hypothetical protein